MIILLIVYNSKLVDQTSWSVDLLVVSKSQIASAFESDTLNCLIYSTFRDKYKIVISQHCQNIKMSCLVEGPISNYK